VIQIVKKLSVSVVGCQWVLVGEQGYLTEKLSDGNKFDSFAVHRSLLTDN